MELPELNLVHACWHRQAIEYLQPVLLPGNRLDRDLLIDATRDPEDEAKKDAPEPTVFKAAEWLTKGAEVPMPRGRTFLDKDAFVRDRVRVTWWDPDATTYEQAALLQDEEESNLPAEPIPAHGVLGYSQSKPIFFGHYWLKGKPRRQTPLALCVDYSVAKDGVLCAYRHDGEAEIDVAKLISVRPNGD